MAGMWQRLKRWWPVGKALLAELIVAYTGRDADTYSIAERTAGGSTSP